MIISNFKTAAKISIILGVLIIIAVVTYIFSFIEYSNKKIYLTIGTLALIAYIFILLKKLHFFEARVQNNYLIVRFYNPHPFISNYKQIKIPVKDFYGYQVKKNLLTQELILKIKQNNKIGIYPPISITALNKEQKEQLFNLLNQLKSKS